MSDFRHAIRVLRTSPTFTLAAVLILALGIGANSAIFALVDAVLLSPLPVPDANRLVVLSIAEPGAPGADYGFSYPGFKDLRDGVPAFAGMLALSGVRLNVSYNGQNQRCSGEVVTGDYFTTLGVRPFLGRLLVPDDDRATGASPVVVLDYAFWQRLGADRGLVGRTLQINGIPMTVVGVTAPEFYGTDLSRRPQLRVPIAMAPLIRPNPGDPTMSRRGHRWLSVMARLRPGVSIEQARASASIAFQGSVRASLAEMPPSASAAWRRQVEGSTLVLRSGAQGRAGMQRDARLPILLLAGATVALLLIACANLANLLLARGAGRAREFAVRGALGGTQWRIARQLMAENLVLSAAAAAPGLLVSIWLSGIVLGFLPEGNALGTELLPDARVVVVTFAISVAAGLLFGLMPALRAARQDPAAALKADAPTMAGAGSAFSLRSVLIVGQVAMSFVLIAGAGLFLRTLDNLNRVDTGFARDHVLVATIDPSLNGYTEARSAALFSDFIQRVQAIPGIAQAGLSSVSPITGSWDVNSITVAGYQPKDGEEPDASLAAVSPGYLEAMGISVKRGRTLNWRDGNGAPLVAVINETMEREYFNGSAVGRRFSLDNAKADVEVVGVVPDGKYVTLREGKAPRFAYFSFLQAPLSGGELTLHARTSGDPLSYLPAIKAQLQALDPTLPLAGVTTLEDQIAESLTSERILATIGSMFAILALLLAAVGIYGVLAFTVARRTREIGLRMALGARPAEVSRMMARHVGVIVGAGVLAGLAGAWSLQGVLRNVLFGVAPADASILFGASLLVGVTGMLAGWLPARHAARMDPLAALRHE
jgi:predicted permease